MKKRFSILLLFSGILLNGASFQLLQDGVAQAKILAPDSVRAAIEHFNREFCQSAGTELNGDGRNIIQIRVQPVPYIERSKFTFSFPEPNRMIIDATEYSVRIALNHILEAAGIRYPMPGPFGGYYPQIRNLALPAEPVSRDAGVRLFRNLYGENPDWMLSLNAFPEDSYHFVNHGIASLFPFDEFKQEKWKDTVWPLIDGERKAPVQHVWEPCYSSEVTLNAAVERICSWLEKNPGRRTIALNHNDGNNQFCQCAQCRALDSRPNQVVDTLRRHGFRFRKHNSESFCAWANKVAERVLEKFPDTYFGISAYNETLQPPTFRLNDRIMVLFCFESFAQTDAGVRAFWQDLVRAWRQKTELTGWWEYGYGLTNFTLPRTYFEEVDQAVKFMMSQNCEVLFVEGFPSLGDGPKRYLYMRYAWNPGLDFQAELQDWYTSCVGKEAATFLQQYYNFWDNFWRSRAVRSDWFNETKFNTYTALVTDGGYLYALAKGDFVRLRGLMESVVQKAQDYGDANQKKRALFLMKEFEFYESSAYLNAAEIIPVQGLSRRADALALAEDIPRIMQHALKRPATAREILETFPKELWGGIYPYMRKGYEQKFTHPVFPDVLMQLRAWLSDEQIRKPFDAALVDASLPESWRKKMQFLLDVDSGKIANIVPDYSFESGRGAWRALGDVSGDQAASGKQSFAFRMPRSGKGEMVLQVPMKPGGKYMLMAKVYLDSDYPPERVTAKGYILGINKLNVGSNYYIPVKTSLLPGKWNSISTSANVGKCGNRGDIYIVVEGMEKGELVYVDDVVFVELSE